MNPFTYKAHPLLVEWIGLITQTTTQPVHDLRHALVILLLTTPVFGIALQRIIFRTNEIRLPFLKALGLSIPAALLYTPLMLTILNDVVHHAFIMSERWFLLFALIVASQLLTAFYAFLIYCPKERGPIGIDSGLGISLFLLLIAIPLGFVLLGIDALIPVF